MGLDGVKRQRAQEGGLEAKPTVLIRPDSLITLLSSPASDLPSPISHLPSPLHFSAPYICSSLLDFGFLMAEAVGSPGGGSHDSGDQSPRSNVREHDRYLPIANISRIMKKALPANGKIAKDAKETVQECVSEFISFITSEASDKCLREKRKTINGDDLIWAMATLGFEEYIDPLKIYLTRYREMEGDTKASTKSGDSSAKNRDSINSKCSGSSSGFFISSS